MYLGTAISGRGGKQSCTTSVPFAGISREALHEIPPRRLELMPGIDKHNVEAAALLADCRQAFANVERGAAIVDGQSRNFARSISSYRRPLE